MSMEKTDVYVQPSPRAPCRVKTLAAAIAGTVIVGGAIVSSAAEPKEASSKPEPSKVQQPAASSEFAEAKPLIGKATSLLQAASEALEHGQAAEARAAIAKAERLVAAAHRLVEEEAEPEIEEHVAAPPMRSQQGRRAPFFDPWGDDAFWGDDNGFGNLSEAMSRLHERMEGMMRQRLGPAPGMEGFKPNMDVEDDGRNYTVKFDLPGVDKDKINVRVEGRLLTVSGESDSTVEQKDQDRVLRKERRRGQFSRTVTLPGPVNGEKLQARYENGVLRIILPKTDEPKELKSVPVL